MGTWGLVLPNRSTSLSLTSQRGRDGDSLRFSCRPSTCGDRIVQVDHEDCDDGNRVNGDGCDQGCHHES